MQSNFIGKRAILVLDRLLVSVLTVLIRVYRVTLSPFIGRQCRFYPTCSHYTEQALAEHGAIGGVWLGAKRIGKCHPWHEGGVDEVRPNGIKES